MKRALLAAVLLAPLPAGSFAQVTPDQAERIRRAAPERATVRPKRSRTVLLWNTPPALMEQDPHKGYCIPYGEEAFRTLGEKTGAFRVVVSDDVAMFLPENLKRFDAVVMNNSSGHWIRPTDADMERLKAHGPDADAVETLLRRSLLDYVKNGGGLVAVHFAIGANGPWPEFRELLGGKFTGHPWNEEVGIRVEEPGHQLLKAFEGKDFRITDEIYEFGEPYDRSKLRVLLSLDTRATNMGVPWITRKDDDFAQAWVKTHGKGRVFYCGFGHRTEVWWNPAVLRFYLDAVQFACGDLVVPTAPRPPAPTRPPEGFVSLFDGRTLHGWEGDPRVWSVQDGAIVGRTTPETPLRENSFLVWKEPVEDFELRLKFRLEGGNSGVYFRARHRPAGETAGEPLVGMQADFDDTGRWTGVLMEYQHRDVLAERGQKVVIGEDGKRQVTGAVDDSQALLRAVKPGAWNDYAVRAQGGRVTLKINGVTMCELDDRDPRRLAKGLLALQTHVGPPMIVRFRDIYLRRLRGGEAGMGARTLVPRIDGPWWQIAGQPDLGDLTGEKQEPMDFAVWQAAAGTWQLWSCIRGTKEAGHTRLLYRWEGARLTDADWKPMGIAMRADPRYGETPGGLQAPHVVRDGDTFHMLYGSWTHICRAESRDGKRFTRVTDADGRAGMFGEGPDANTRDPMLLRVGKTWHCYYTAFPDRRGAVYARVSNDLRRWSEARIVCEGGRAGNGPFSAECPHVVYRQGCYYLFRTERYGRENLTHVYRSDDPLSFGRDEDARYRVGSLPVAAPEVVTYDGQDYLAALPPELDGIRVARLAWVPAP